MRVLKALPVVVLLAAGWSCANAAADFITIQRSQTNLDDVTPRLLVNFTLPSTLNRSSSTSNSAVLDLDALGVEFNFNEIYVNPDSTVCVDNDNDGTNQPNSLNFLREHDDDNLKTEWATNHVAFSSALLLTGANQLMICARSETGDSGSGNLDNVSTKNIVLHYHTSP
jgi:hypothetical protein